MADVNAILAAFRADLIAAGLVRRPSEPEPVGAPPMHVEPVEGPPAPGEREGVEDDPDLVLSLMHSGDLAEGTGYAAAAQRRTVLDVRYRSRTAGALQRAAALDATIRRHFTRPQRNYGYGFLMAPDLIVDEGQPTERSGALWVQELGVWGGMGPVGRSRAAGYDHVAKYVVIVAP